MGHKEFSWTSIDRQHELDGEAQEAYEVRLDAETKTQAAAIRQNAILRHEQTLDFLADGFAARISQPGITEELIRVVLAAGPYAAGLALRAIVEKCVEADAEIAAIKEIERQESAGGLDMAAIRAAAPHMVVPV